VKYLAAASGADLDAKISKRFGHAAYFLVIDPETMEFTVIPGVGDESPVHGIGHFTTRDIQCVLVGNIGPSLFSDLVSAGMKVYSFHGITVREAVVKVHSGLVSPLDEPTMKRSIHEGGRGQGGGGGHSGGGHGRGLGRRQR